MNDSNVIRSEREEMAIWSYKVPTCPVNQYMIYFFKSFFYYIMLVIIQYLFFHPILVKPFKGLQFLAHLAPSRILLWTLTAHTVSAKVSRVPPASVPFIITLWLFPHGMHAFLPPLSKSHSSAGRPTSERLLRLCLPIATRPPTREPLSHMS